MQNKTKANDAENSSLYWTPKKTFCFGLNLFCFKLTSCPVLENWAQRIKIWSWK